MLACVIVIQDLKARGGELIAMETKAELFHGKKLVIKSSLRRAFSPR